MDYPCAKFGDFSFSRLVLSCKQNHRQKESQRQILTYRHTIHTYRWHDQHHHHHHHHKCLVPGRQRTGSASQYKSQYNINSKLIALIKNVKKYVFR